MYNYKKLNDDQIEYLEVADASELGIGERLYVEIDRDPIVIFNIAGQLFAIADVCSHDNGPVGDGRLDGNEIACPRHGARFDIRTGKVLSLPAIVDIPAYPVRVREERIEVGVPRKG
jgi:3-phenylpropionate/trans-cinnamate dioxygenase ferredoxin subunit